MVSTLENDSGLVQGGWDTSHSEKSYSSSTTDLHKQKLMTRLFLLPVWHSNCVQCSRETVGSDLSCFWEEQYSACIVPQMRNGSTASSPLIGRFCGSTLPSPIFPQSNTLYLHCKSDFSSTRDGFDVTWTSSPNGQFCNLEITIRSKNLILPVMEEWILPYLSTKGLFNIHSPTTLSGTPW